MVYISIDPKPLNHHSVTLHLICIWNNVFLCWYLKWKQHTLWNGGDSSSTLCRRWWPFSTSCDVSVPKSINRELIMHIYIYIHSLITKFKPLSYYSTTGLYLNQCLFVLIFEYLKLRYLTQVRKYKVKQWHGPLARYLKLQVAYAPGMPEAFFSATAG